MLVWTVVFPPLYKPHSYKNPKYFYRFLERELLESLRVCVFMLLSSKSSFPLTCNHKFSVTPHNLSLSLNISSPCNHSIAKLCLSQQLIHLLGVLSSRDPKASLTSSPSSISTYFHHPFDYYCNASSTTHILCPHIQL